mmetsp:Transcript_16368/g.18476  ORF Transcript_16368/g.18476 Transcript_16368/m.18476 type:complete len:279 (-) Transcript_16368:318-1154(-)
MLSKSLAGSSRAVFKTALNQSKCLTKVPLRTLFHFRNLNEEIHAEEIHNAHQDNPVVAEAEKIYKPSHTVEFDRVGECLLYSCDPFKHMNIYLKYPYVFYESLIPLSVWMYYVNPLSLTWQYKYWFLLAATAMWWPRAWYIHDMRRRVHKVHLLRGGKVVKITVGQLSGDRWWSWTENHNFNLLTEDKKDFEEDVDKAAFVDEEGQLKYELHTQLDLYEEFQATTLQDAILVFMKEGVIHEPEIFQQVLRGYYIDTSDYTINTGNNMRHLEPWDNNTF